MKIYDISQELFSCKVYPGDRSPRLIEDSRTKRGDLYNLTSLEMCTHNGTHVDAPFHFLPEGDTAESIELEKAIGYCYITMENCDIDEARAKEIMRCAALINKEAEKRILIKGQGVVTASAARAFASGGIYLIGSESQSVGPEASPMEVHKILLSEGVVLLEGIRLSEISRGVYFLFAAPLALKGSDGSPCRAVLLG